MTLPVLRQPLVASRAHTHTYIHINITCKRAPCIRWIAYRPKEAYTNAVIFYFLRFYTFDWVRLPSVCVCVCAVSRLFREFDGGKSSFLFPLLSFFCFVCYSAGWHFKWFLWRFSVHTQRHSNNRLKSYMHCAHHKMSGIRISDVGSHWAFVLRLFNGIHDSRLLYNWHESNANRGLSRQFVME